MKIRKATKKDLEAIFKLLYEYTKYENNLDKKVNLESLAKIRKEETKHFKTGTLYFVIEENKKIIGCLNANIDKRGKGKVGVIHNLFILEEARGKGYGNELVKFAFKYFKEKGCSKAKTFVFLKNKKAKTFWEKKGFNLDLGYSGSVKLK